MLNQLRPNRQLEERAGCLPVSGARLYQVLHEVKDLVARVLLVATFGSERRCQLPVKIETLSSDAAPLTKGGLVGYDDLKDFNWLYAPNRAWIAAITSQSSREAAYA